jgi:hypothetical protein
MKKKNLNSLSLNKSSISNLDALTTTGGKLGASGVDCVTQVGSCQTTSCVCTQNPLVCAPSWDGTCGTGNLSCIPPIK